jgi:putative ABC transport system permease protein
MSQSLWSDFVRAGRSLRRSPGFVAIASLSLGAALGLSTAVFGFIDAMRHPESPIRRVEEVFEIQVARWARMRPPQREMERQIAMLSGVARVAAARVAWADVDANDYIERMPTLRTRPGYFDLLDARPRLGRLPSRAEQVTGGVAVVSDGLWRRRFGNLRAIGPASVSVGGRRYPVIGVFPARASAREVDVWLPDESLDAEAGIVVRLHAGVSEDEMNPRLKAFAERLTREYAAPGERAFNARMSSMRVDPLELKDFHRAMIGAAIAVLLIACANIAALMLARGNVRMGEYALQMALGATPWELGRQVLVEVVTLAAIGTIAGAVVASWTVALLSGAMPEQMQWMGFTQPQWSLRVFVQGATAVFVAVAVAGGYPAWRASRIDPAGPLKDGTGGFTGRRATRFRLLVMAELALAMTLLVSASLMAKSVHKMSRYDWGYDAHGLLQVNYWWRGDTSWTMGRQATERALLERLRALPEVQGAARVAGCGDALVVTSDRTAEGGALLNLPVCNNVSAAFFGTFGIPLVEGRDFSDADAVGSDTDSTTSGGAAILDENAARRLFPHETAVGRMVKLGKLSSKRPWLRVVGVARSRRLGFDWFPEMGPDSSAALYVSLPTDQSAYGSVVVRPVRNVRSAATTVQRLASSALPPRSFVRVEPWTQGYDDALLVERFLSLVFTLLAAVALLLGAAGLFSVISYVATQRSREFAVRIALGASPSHVRRLVLRDAVFMALGGTAVGAGLGMWAGFLLWDKMWGVYPVDAGALIGAEVVLLAVTLLACLLPAVRASRSNPMTIIRAA